MAIRNKNIEAPGDAPRYACRAWVNFDGTTTPPTIRASGNVSTITRNDTGDYTVNFIDALEDTNYSVMLTANTEDGTTFSSHIGVLTVSNNSYSLKTTMQTRFITRNTVASNYNSFDLNFAVFR